MLDDLDPLACGARRLRDKVCVVTGAGQGIGRATARRLAAEGARVVLAERVESSARETARQLEEAGAPTRTIIVDLSTLPQAERLMRETLDAFGRIDVLVNVVGGTIWWQPYQDYSEEQIMLELERSLYTAMWCCKAVLPTMIAQRGGSIINLGSSVTKGGLYRAPYAVSKGGLEALTKVLAAENGRYGVRVNGVAPGTTIIPDRTTSRLTLRPGEEAHATPGTHDFVQETRAGQRGALNHAGRPEDQAAAIAFLASEDAAFITGVMIDCSGGSR